MAVRARAFRLPAVLFAATLLACVVIHCSSRESGPVAVESARPRSADAGGGSPARVSTAVPTVAPREPGSAQADRRSPPDAGGSRALALLVVRDVDGSPVGDADVSVHAADDTPVLRRSTSSDGTAELALEQGVDAEIAVRHPRFAAFVARTDALDLTDGRAEVVLDPGGSITGIVRLPGGGAPTVPVRVMARPAAGARLDDTEARRALANDSRVLTAVTDASGAFEIPGAPLDTDLTVIGAGPGLMQVGAPQVVRAGGEGASVVVAPLYVLDVGLIDETTGRPIRAMTWLRAASGYSPSFPVPQDAMARFPSSYATLAWAGAARAPSGSGGDARTFMAFAVDSEAERYGPIALRAVAPGYEPRVVQVWAPRVRPQAEVAQRVALRRTCRGFGTIRVVPQGASARLQARMSAIESAVHLNAPSLALWCEDARLSLDVDLRAMGRGPVAIDGVPAGTYRAQVSIPLGWRPLCARVQEIDLAVGGVVEIVLELEGCPIVDLRVERETGELHTGALQVLGRRVPGDVGGAWSFEGPVYTLIGLDPGTYEICAIGSSASEPVLVVVEPGGESEARIVLKDGRRR